MSLQAQHSTIPPGPPSEAEPVAADTLANSSARARAEPRPSVAGNRQQSISVVRRIRARSRVRPSSVRSEKKPVRDRNSRGRKRRGASSSSRKKSKKSRKDKTSSGSHAKSSGSSSPRLARATPKARSETSLPSPTSPAGPAPTTEAGEPTAPEVQNSSSQASVPEAIEARSQPSPARTENTVPTVPLQGAQTTAKASGGVPIEPVPSSIPELPKRPLPFKNIDWNRQAIRRGEIIASQLANDVAFFSVQHFRSAFTKSTSTTSTTTYRSFRLPDYSRSSHSRATSG